jgi:hypothetical protein
MYLFTIIPFLYFLKTRLKGKVQRVSWVFVYFIPGFVLFAYFVSLDDWRNFILLIIGITLVNYVYENGYIQNDIKTIKREKNPTLRVSADKMHAIDKNWNKLVFIRGIISLFLLGLFYILSSDVSLTLGLLLVSAFLQALYLVYNSIRNIWNLILLLPISYIRFYGFVVPFLSKDVVLEFIIATVLLYPFSKVLEFTKRERFNLLFIGNKLGNVDKFRIIYYLIVCLFLSFVSFESIYIQIALYYLIFRLLSYCAVSKSENLKNAVGSNFSRQEIKQDKSYQYSGFERKIAFVLTKFPGLKAWLKKGYQKLNYIRYKKPYNYKSDYSIKQIKLENKESYFGYYDKSPINSTNEYIIFQSTNIATTNMPDPKVPVDIVVYEVINDSYEIIDQSYAYNWQQGTKLMWVDDYKFIYNDFEINGQQYISKIYDVKTKKTKIVHCPIYDCFAEKFAISLNFERLDIARADYSYSNIGVKIDWKDNKNDGLYYVDLKANTSKLIVTLEDIIKLNYKDTMKGAKHKFNHVMISPDGQKMMYMHRWFLSDSRKFDALYISNVDGSDIKLMSDADMVSHCFWAGEENILGYLRSSNNKDAYWLINVPTGKFTHFAGGVLDQYGDGHPHVCGDWFVTDTYPDKARMQHLILCNLKTGEVRELGEFFHGFEYGYETRCDLHPRFSPDGKIIFFDSVFNGSRNLYRLDL